MRVMEHLSSIGERMQKAMKTAALLCIFWLTAGILSQTADGPKAGDNPNKPLGTIFWPLNF